MQSASDTRRQCTISVVELHAQIVDVVDVMLRDKCFDSGHVGNPDVEDYLANTIQGLSILSGLNGVEFLQEL